MFLLFGGQTYYAEGGWNDYQGSYFTADEAITKGESLMDNSIEWFHVVDLDLGELVHVDGFCYS